MPWYLAIILLSGANGLRTLTPIAVLCWFAYTGNLPVVGTWAFFTSNAISLAVFSLLALGELVGDKLPQTPNRIAAGPLVARIAFGGLVGAILATTLFVPVAVGAGLGGASAVVGAFAGFHLRRNLTKSGNRPDFLIALAEDAITIGISVAAVFATR